MDQLCQLKAVVYFCYMFLLFIVLYFLLFIFNFLSLGEEEISECNETGASGDAGGENNMPVVEQQVAC